MPLFYVTVTHDGKASMSCRTIIAEASSEDDLRRYLNGRYFAKNQNLDCTIFKLHEGCDGDPCRHKHITCVSKILPQLVVANR